MKNILIVEDNDTNYMLLEEILSDYNVVFERAVDGEQFYSKIKEKYRAFDLVLMDLMLPDTDGIALTKYLINQKIRIPVIFISAYTERCEEIFDLGVEYFISKPVMTELLISNMSKYIAIENVKKQSSLL